MIAQSKENANDTWDFRLTINDFRSGCYFSLVSHPLIEHEALQEAYRHTITNKDHTFWQKGIFLTCLEICFHRIMKLII